MTHLWDLSQNSFLPSPVADDDMYSSWADFLEQAPFNSNRHYGMSMLGFYWLTSQQALEDEDVEAKTHELRLHWLADSHLHASLWSIRVTAEDEPAVASFLLKYRNKPVSLNALKSIVGKKK